MLPKDTLTMRFSKILHVDRSVITRDVAFLNEQSKKNIKSFVNEKLPEEFECIYIGLNLILREAWLIALQTEDRKAKLASLELARSCYLNKMDLLTNARVISDAIALFTRFLPEMDKAKQDRKDKNITAADMANTIKELEEKDERNCINSVTTDKPVETETEEEDQAEQKEPDEGIF